LRSRRKLGCKRGHDDDGSGSISPKPALNSASSRSERIFLISGSAKIEQAAEALFLHKQ
jgi:hypothetical protein